MTTAYQLTKAISRLLGKGRRSRKPRSGGRKRKRRKGGYAGEYDGTADRIAMKNWAHDTRPDPPIPMDPQTAILIQHLSALMHQAQPDT